MISSTNSFNEFYLFKGSFRPYQLQSHWIKTATSLAEKAQPLDPFNILQLNLYQSATSLSLCIVSFSLLYQSMLPSSIVAFSFCIFAVSWHNRIEFISNRHWLALRVGCTLGWFYPRSAFNLLPLSLCQRATSAAVWFSSMKFVHMPLKWAQLALYKALTSMQQEQQQWTKGNISINSSSQRRNSLNALQQILLLLLLLLWALLKCTINGKVTTVFPSEKPPQGTLSAVPLPPLSPPSLSLHLPELVFIVEEFDYENMLTPFWAKQRRLPANIN